MSQIKKFFSKIKSEVKFATAGEGHRLSEPTTSPPTQPQSRPMSSSKPVADSGPAARAAGQAAQQRFQQQTSIQQSATANTRTADSIRRQAQRELEQERTLQNQLQDALNLKEHYFGSRQISVESPRVVDQSSLLFKCTDVFGDDIRLPYSELQQQIEETLRLQLNSEPLVAATLLFLTCNQREKEKLETGKQIICKYFDNIITNPDEEKFRRIRLQNKVYLEKVASLKYSLELLNASGFSISDDQESLVYQERSIEPLQLALDTLDNGQPIQVQLDRNLKIFEPTKEKPSIPPVQLLPQDPIFYHMTVGDVLREKQRQKEILEKEEMLRTKAMRERDEKPESNIQYKYTVIRVRLPNEMIIQAIFQSNDTITTLFEFLRTDCLVHDWVPFTLTSNADRRVYLSQENYALSFQQCGLVPAAILSFQWNEQSIREIQQQNPGFPVNTFLKSDILLNANRL